MTEATSPEGQVTSEKPGNSPESHLSEPTSRLDTALATFEAGWRLLADEVHRTAVEHGWWENNHPNVGEKLMLAVGELHEAHEEYRKYGFDGLDHIYYDADKPEGFPVEIADTLIRLMDFCTFWRISIPRAMRLKVEYNETRPYRHGNKHA